MKPDLTNFTKHRFALYIFVVLSWVILFGLLPFSKITIDLASFKQSFVNSYALAAIFSVLNFTKFSLPKKDVLLKVSSRLPSRLSFLKKICTSVIYWPELLALSSLLTPPIFMASHMAQAMDLPLQDEALAGYDALLGFNWHGFVMFIDSHALLADIFGCAYNSIISQGFLIPLILLIMNQRSRAYGFVILFTAICFIASFISIWFPAYGTYTYFQVFQTDLNYIDAYYGFQFLEDYNNLRSAEPYVIHADRVAGILTFPSVHSAASFIFIWALWNVRWLRWPCVALNLIMAMSAISHANHYFADVLAGALITALLVLVCDRYYCEDVGRNKVPSPAYSAS